MRKSELKTGMLVELRSGSKYMTLKNTTTGNLFVSVASSMVKTFGEYRADLTSKKNKQLDIVAVYDAESLFSYSNPENFTKIWEEKGDYAKSRICLVKFPNSEKEYAFEIPKELYELREGEKAIVETRNGHKVVVTITKIFGNENEAMTSEKMEDVELPLCEVISAV